VTLDDLVAAVRAAVATFVDRPGPIPIDRTRDPEHGDYASPVLLRSGAVAAAAQVAAVLTGHPGIDRAWSHGPGFLNIRLDDRATAATVRTMAAPPNLEPFPIDPPGTLIEAVGEPAARYAQTRPGRSSIPWTRANDANPFYLVQFAGVTAANVRRWGVPDTAEEDRELLVDLATFPWHAPTPDGLARALERVAAGYLRSPRLDLADATRLVITAGLARLGIAAAERL
jgi:Arginyl tRNA synthetase N terminal domain